jgi:hypothetical protein
MIAAGVVLLAAFLVLRDDGNAPEPASGAPDGAGAQSPGESRGPGAPRRAADMAMRPRSDPWTSDPTTLSPNLSGHLGSRPQGGMGGIETYRFRPLGERERRRIEQRSWEPHGSSNDPGEPWQRAQPAPTAPNYQGYPPQQRPWTPGWENQDWGTQGYSFRPVEPSRGTRERWEGPYSTPRWPEGGYPPPPDPFQTPGQWGAIAPERSPSPYRMYRSFDAPRDRSPRDHRFSLR